MIKRVYEIAKELRINSKDVIQELGLNNINVKNHMSIVDEKEQELLYTKFSNGNKIIDNFNSSSLKMIEINGLFGYYDYRINLREDINIFVAENGFGKTTILNIIVALLKNDKEKLRKLPFEHLKVGINRSVIEIDRKELLEIDYYEQLLKLSKKYVPMNEYRYIINKFNEDSIEEFLFYLRDYVPRDIIMKYVIKNNNEKDNNVYMKLGKIQNLLKEEVVYLPTYRRIEEETDFFKSLPLLEKRRVDRELKKSSLNFGMNDVINIITEITENQRNEAIKKYSEMTGEILDDLLLDKNINVQASYEIDKEKIRIMINRIGKENIKHHKLLDQYIDNPSEFKNDKFISYFLYKLILIYESQKEIDDKIKSFVNVCNKYLVNKTITYNEILSRVTIINDEIDKVTDIEDNIIDFNKLSSGEKQIISLFAKLYLDISDKVIFIIDEPELSLSIIWQKTLLEDIYNTQKVALLIATTHSPFIFENSFSNYAKELRTYRMNEKRKK